MEFISEVEVVVEEVLQHAEKSVGTKLENIRYSRPETSELPGIQADK